MFATSKLMLYDILLYKSFYCTPLTFIIYRLSTFNYLENLMTTFWGENQRVLCANIHEFSQVIVDLTLMNCNICISNVWMKVSRCLIVEQAKTKISEMIKPNIFNYNFETDVIWYIALQIFLLHAIGIYNLLTFNYLKNLMTTFWIIGMYFISNLGVSAGAHRLWSHKGYKAKLPLRILFLICFSSSAQNSIYNWVKNHRMHHKYCDTNADPHNPQRGIFFAHMGWVMMTEHPEFIKKSKQINLSDVLSDPVVIFNKRYSLLLQFIFAFILPTAVPIYLWNETLGRAIISQIFIRYMLTLNSIWSINSIAHAWGTKPYDKNINPSDNELVNFVTVGEGYHNFHHVFPWDYRSSEKGNNHFNYATIFIDFCAKLGQAYDLKYPSIDLIRKIILKKGDGTHPMLSEVPRSESD